MFGFLNRVKEQIKPTYKVGDRVLVANPYNYDTDEAVVVELAEDSAFARVAFPHYVPSGARRWIRTSDIKSKIKETNNG